MLLDKEVKMWAQGSRIMWLNDGDSNTRFFHSQASQRRRRNYIRNLYDHAADGALNQHRLQPQS